MPDRDMVCHTDPECNRMVQSGLLRLVQCKAVSSVAEYIRKVYESVSVFSG